MRGVGPLVAAVWIGGLPAGSSAETAPDAQRLQRNIEGASELGNYSRVQTLRLQLAERSAAAGLYAAAARQYQLLLAARPAKSERARLNTRLGDMRSALGDWSGAIGAYGDALHDEPKNWDASLRRARAFGKVELNTQALDQYRRCIRLKPERSEAYSEIGGIYQRLGYLTKAIESYQASLALKRQPELYLQIADCYLREGDMDRAAAELHLAKTQLPHAEYDVRLGDIDRKRGNLAQAAAAWEDVLRAEASRDDVRLKLALVDEELHRNVAADREMEVLLAHYPQSPLVHFFHAWILARRGARAGARAEVDEVQHLRPSAVVAHYNDRLLKEIQK